jgi:PST family polysaccharide transporter
MVTLEDYDMPIREEEPKTIKQPTAEKVGGLARKGVGWSALQFFGRQGISLVATAILTRILAPGDYGLMAMVMTLTALFDVFSDLGLSWVTVQEPDLTRVHVDNLFWIGTAGGFALWGICAASGPALDAFYGRNDLGPVAAAAGAGFVFSSMAIQPTSLLRRQLQISTIARAEITSQVVSSLLGVTVAFLGGRYWALVMLGLSKQFTYLVLIFWRARYWPALPHQLLSMTRFVRFGAYLSANGFLVYIARNLDNVLVGKFWGAEQLAFYSRAYFLMLLPASIATGILATVAVPALSAVSHDRERMGAAFRKGLRAISALAFPLAIGLCVAAPGAVRLIYGPKWTAVVPLLRWLCLASISQPIYMTVGWLYISVGKGREMFFWSLTQAIILAITFTIAVRWGATGVSAAYGIVATGCIALPGLYAAHRASALRYVPSLLVLRRPLVAAVTMGAAAWLAGALVSRLGWSWGAVLAAQVLIGAIVYLCVFGLRSLVESLFARPIPEDAWKQFKFPSFSLGQWVA